MKVAFVFPGQGSQSVGMLNDFEGHPVVSDVVARASEALGEDLGQLIAQGPAETLNLTVNTQPALLTASYAMYAAYLAEGGRKPDMMAGHSLGEYSALTAAGVFSLADAVKTVRFRAQAMQSAVPVGVGTMAAILGLDDDTVRGVCEQAAEGEVVEPVNYNSPGQVVIAGHKGAVERACQLASQAGARRALVLPVSAPFHSSLLRPAAERLAEQLAQTPMNAPTIPVIANVDVVAHEDVDAIRRILALQAASSVQWVKTILAMQEAGVTHIVECGPGRVLNGLIRRIAPSITVLNINSKESLAAVLDTDGFRA